MNRDRSHSTRDRTVKRRENRWLRGGVIACLLAVAVTSLAASTSVLAAPPIAHVAALTHSTKAKKGNRHPTCKQAKKKRAKARKGKKRAGCKTVVHKHKKHRKHKKKPTQAQRTKVRNPSGPSPALFNRQVYGYASSLSPQAEARRYSVMVLQGTDAGMVPILHAANPHLKIFVYVDILRAAVGGLQSCTLLSTDQSQHPDWLLTDSNGQSVEVANVFHLDIGNPAYQQACVSGAIAMAKNGHFDGVYFDGLDGQPAYGFGGHTPPVIPKYTSTAVWQAAITSFLARATPQIHAAGLPVIGNIGGETPAQFERWEGLMDGAEDESWTDLGNGLAQWLYWWPAEMADIKWSEAHGKLLILHSHNKTEAGNTYGLAAMLLAANGHTSYSTSNGGYGGYEAWYPEYSTAEQLGAPLGGYTRGPGRIYERRFAHGIVLVNASTRTVDGVGLGGTYSGSGLSHVNRVTLGPTTGLILVAG
jgi:hypothetical protein